MRQETTDPETILRIFNSKNKTQIKKGTQRRCEFQADYRACYYKLCRDFTDLSLVNIAKSLESGFDHTTVIHGIEKMFPYMSTNNRTAFEGYEAARLEIIKDVLHSKASYYKYRYEELEKAKENLADCENKYSEVKKLFTPNNENKILKEIIRKKEQGNG